jgi:hypothetical protein
MDFKTTYTKKYMDSVSEKCRKNAQIGTFKLLYYILLIRVVVGEIEKALVSGGSSQRPNASARLKH